MSPIRSLVVMHNAAERHALAAWLQDQGHQVTVCGDVRLGLEDCLTRVVDLVLLSMDCAGPMPEEVIERFRGEGPWTRVVAVADTIEAAADAIRYGASDYVVRPLNRQQVQLTVRRSIEQRELSKEAARLRSIAGGEAIELDYRSACPEMQTVVDRARQAAATNSSVLLSGEPGTGRRWLARLIHTWSSRSAAPLVTVGCQGHTAESWEAEVLGVSTASPMGEVHDSPGLVSTCDGGTILLDEVENLLPSLQPKVLRLIRDRQYERLNDFHVRHADVRVLATARPSTSSTPDGRLREDLATALGVVRLELPPLRERKQDIRALARHFRLVCNRENHREIAGFMPEALQAMEQYAWPGNIRELRNMVERAVLVCTSDRIGLADLPASIVSTTAPTHSVGDPVPLEVIHETHIQKIMAMVGSVTRAARILGIHPNTLRRWLRQRRGIGLPVDEGNTQLLI